MIRALVAGCVTAVAAAGQTGIEIQLPADPSRRGPPALVQARAMLPEFGAAVHDPFSALRLELDADGLRVQPDAAPVPMGVALRAKITVDGEEIRAECDQGGLETWRASHGRALRTPTLRALAAQFDLVRAPGPVWFDVAALVGGRLAGVQMESPLGRLSTLGAVECGDLVVRLDRVGDDVVVVGRSRGGLLLPALLLHLAAQNTPTPTSTQAWQLLAYAARDSRREEATMHLALARDPTAPDALRSLLFADDMACGRAAEALARRREPEALARLTHALRTATPTQRPALEAAVATLWPLADTAERRRARIDATPGLVDTMTQAPAMSVGLLIARAITALLLLIAGTFLVTALHDRSARDP
ncbi:MAG: hypothetical protein IPM13_19555 [Phycisphaerales bacterium]|nr:hypothetical protein [Phycisphaerales bacterium]